MTRGEFLDLVRFLTELGKPGKYAFPDAAAPRNTEDPRSAAPSK